MPTQVKRDFWKNEVIGRYKVKSESRDSDDAIPALAMFGSGECPQPYSLDLMKRASSGICLTRSSSSATICLTSSLMRT